VAEWHLAEHVFLQDDTNAEQVHGESIPFLDDHLRGHVVVGTEDCVCTLTIEFFGKAEVD